MKVIAQILLCYSGISCVVLAVVSMVLGWPESKLPIEILRLPRTSFQDEARRVILESRNLSTAKQPLLLIMGASASQEAFRPHLLGPMVPEYSVNNLALGGANITEVRQTLELALKHIRHDLLKESVLILPVCYPMFVKDIVRWNLPAAVPAAAIAAKVNMTDVEREALVAPPIYNPEHPFFRVAPGWFLGAAKSRYAVLSQLAPQLPTNLADKVLRWKEWRMELPHHKRRRLQQEVEAPTQAVPSAGGMATMPDPSDRMAWNRWQMNELGRWMRMGAPRGGIPAEQFDQLAGLLKTASGAGLRIFVIDLPLPSWHRAESPYVAPYQILLKATLSPFVAGGQAKLISLADQVPDDEFQDCAHPTAESAEHWCRLALERTGIRPAAPHSEMNVRSIKPD